MNLHPLYCRSFWWTLLAATAASGQAPGPARPARPPGRNDTPAVVNRYTALVFSGSGQDLIQAMATDALGYIYVTGSTTSPDFPVKNAFQPRIGSAQLMRSTDRGVTWVKLTSPPPANGLQTEITPHPSLPQVLFAASGNRYGADYRSAISKSTDGGQSWREIWTAASSMPNSATQVTINPFNTSMMVADVATGASFTSTGLIFSNDGGETWSAPACPVFHCGGSTDQLVADPLNAGGLAASLQTGLFISSNWGQTFTKFGPDICCGTASVLYDPFHGGWIYVAYNPGASGNLFLSTDDGKTWITKTVPQTSVSAIQTLVADRDVPGMLYEVSLDGTVYESADAADTWTRLANLNVASGMVAETRSCGPGGGLLSTVGFSADFGNTWQPLPFEEVVQLATGPGCALYAAQSPTTDAFMAKLSPDGSQVVWATFLGGNESDSASAVAVDGQGNVYMGGTTSSGDFPVTDKKSGKSGTQMAFAAKFDTNGNILYSTLLNATSVSAMAVDSQGDAWLTGLASEVFPTTPGAFDTHYDSGGLGDVYLAKIGPAGDFLYGSFIGTNYPTPALAVNSQGDPIVAGAGGFSGHPPPLNASTGFVLRLDSTGSELTGAITIQGTSSNPYDGPQSLSLDGAGNVYVLGRTSASDFTTTPGAFFSGRSGRCQAGLLEAGDIFVMKLSATSLSPVYSALLGGMCGSEPGTIYVDGTGEATFSLSTGASFPLSHPLISRPPCGLPDFLEPGTGSGVISRLSADGSTLLFSTFSGACGVPAIAPGNPVSIPAGLSFDGSADPRARIVQFPAGSQPVGGVRGTGRL